jgi:polysaccharide pyruvyl transferase
VVVVGSIATMLPRQYTGAVLGIGKARETPIDLSRADVRAVRGPMTLAGSGVMHPVALGDPGLLAPLLLEERPDTTNAIGVVPHWQDTDLAVREWDRHTDALLIDVRRPPEQVIAEIASCERIVSSSLHGLIVADAFGIPRQWSWFSKIQGGGFKVADYAASIGFDIQPGKTRTAPRQRVEQVQSDLREAIAQWVSYQVGDYA